MQYHLKNVLGFLRSHMCGAQSKHLLTQDSCHGSQPFDFDLHLRFMNTPGKT